MKCWQQVELEGDNYVINGSKIWTSGAHNADWMFILVRTDRAASKHEGISFMLLPMDQKGITVKPIPLISGVSTFNETFFDNALAARVDLVGELNKGWTVGKRLLQHERSGMESLRQFFFTRAASIYSGSNEIQRNIIAKRVLGLPD